MQARTQSDVEISLGRDATSLVIFQHYDSAQHYPIIAFCINETLHTVFPHFICPIIQLYAHTHPFNGPLSGTTRVSQYQKGKPIWILLKQETVSASGISWAICKSAPRSRQITMPAPHHSVFIGRMPFLPSNQQRQSIEGMLIYINTI